ncbi:MAG: hypothetical protein WC756_16165 [Taibaiella sp.]
MNKILCFLAIIFLPVSGLYAASEEDFKLDVIDTIKDHTAFNEITVLDLRSNKADLGYLKLGPLNKKVMLVPKEGFTEMLEQFAKQTTQQATSKGNAILLIVVRDFTLTDRPTGGEMGTFYARMDFYLGSQDRFIHQLHIDSLFETANGWDVTKNVRRIAAQKTTNWLKRMAGNATRELSGTTMTKAEITVDITQENKIYPVYSEVQKKGVYYTLEEFLNNTPGDTAFVQRDDFMDGRKISYFYKKEEGKRRGADLDKIPCYAVYNGQKWFKKTSYGLTLMKYRDGDFYFPEVGQGLRANDDVAIMFGLVGALVAAGTSGSKGNALYNIRLDPKTGGGFCTERLR